MAIIASIHLLILSVQYWQSTTYASSGAMTEELLAMSRKFGCSTFNTSRAWSSKGYSSLQQTCLRKDYPISSKDICMSALREPQLSWESLATNVSLQLWNLSDHSLLTRSGINRGVLLAVLETWRPSSHYSDGF